MESFLNSSKSLRVVKEERKKLLENRDEEIKLKKQKKELKARDFCMIPLNLKVFEDAG